MFADCIEVVTVVLGVSTAGDWQVSLTGGVLGPANVTERSAVPTEADAGPGRPQQWVSLCDDPRGGSTDPLDFVECIPFSETRNYVMRTMETTQVYRARLNGGTAPLTLASDLKRGAYTYSVAPQPSR